MEDGDPSLTLRMPRRMASQMMNLIAVDACGHGPKPTL